MTRLNNLLDPKLTFIAGWFVGRRSRRRAGAGCFLLFLGLFLGCSGIMTLMSAPLSWLRTQDITALPQPQFAELNNLPAGTQMVVTAQLPPDLPVDASGLAVFYVEGLASATVSIEHQPATTPAANWQIIEPPPLRIGMALANGQPLLVQIAPNARFLNAQQVALDGKDFANSQRRAVGYQAGQVLTLQGRWEGNGLLTATELYAGSSEEYLADLRRLPGLGLAVGLGCSGIGFFLCALGALLRFVGG